MSVFGKVRYRLQTVFASGLLLTCALPLVAQAATNLAPVIGGSAPTTITPGSLYYFSPSASDANGDRLQFSLSNRPSWLFLNSRTGQLFGFAPRSLSSNKTYANLVLSVSDGKTSTKLPTFSITVMVQDTGTGTGNHAPTISGSASTSVTAGSAYAFQPSGSDPDGQTLTWSIANKPSWATFSTSSGRLSGTPSSGTVGTTSNITISVSDGALSASLPSFSIVVNAIANRAPTISGSPSTSVVAGNVYGFTPTASDPDGNMLAFSISGKPTWATFSVSSGKLSGTPTATQTGYYANIVISVNDGSVSKALPTFAINVTAPAPTTGSASLSWSAPTQNTDGSSLTNLSGYWVYHGTSAGALNEITQVPGATNVGYVFSQLPRGTHYFAVAAYNSDGVESAMSAVGSKTIP